MKSDIIFVGDKNLTPPQKTFIESLPKQQQADYESYIYEKEFWNRIQTEPTPINLLKEREGFKNKDGIAQILEYFPEEYTLNELNRLFPGWWEEEMRLSPSPEIVALQTAIVTGYLCVEYPTPKGMKITKRWACAGSEVIFKTNTKIPLDLGDTIKSARTEWIKVAGKHFGIGLDIYHQRITPELMSAFEDTIRHWGKYADDVKKLVPTLTTGHAFRNMLKGMPNAKQSEEFVELMSKVPESQHDAFWRQFLKLNNKSAQNTAQIEKWLKDIAVAVEKMKVNN